MKTLPAMALICTIGLVFASPTTMLAQSKKHSPQKHQKTVGPPPWAPAHGYRAKTRYVFFRDYDMYYDHDRGVYIYLKNERWEIGMRIPSFLEGVDLKSAVRINIELDTDMPELYYQQHKKLKS